LSPEGAPEIDVALVRRLLARQAPEWADLPLSPVEPQGWDNRTFRLGGGLAVRLPSRSVYAGQVETEAAWLPLLSGRVPLEIPEVVFLVKPSDGYPWGWSIRRWIDGDAVSNGTIADRAAFAKELGGFLRAFQAIDPAGGPTPGERNFHRGGDLRVYAGQAREAITAIGAAAWANALWDRALSPASGEMTWVHGDVSPGNLLVREGRLSAVIDFGLMAVGDPACDFAIGWTFMTADERKSFRLAAGVHDCTWRRAVGWALWKAAVVLAGWSGGEKERQVA